jgi:hypothetical protein
MQNRHSRADAIRTASTLALGAMSAAALGSEAWAADELVITDQGGSSQNANAEAYTSPS